jgi:hypothetical protein
VCLVESNSSPVDGGNEIIETTGWESGEENEKNENAGTGRVESCHMPAKGLRAFISAQDCLSNAVYPPNQLF